MDYKASEAEREMARGYDLTIALLDKTITKLEKSWLPWKRAKIPELRGERERLSMLRKVIFGAPDETE